MLSHTKRLAAEADLYRVDNQYRSVDGSFDRAAPQIAIIDHHYSEHGKTYCYSNVGHYQLVKHGLFPRTKRQLSK